MRRERLWFSCNMDKKAIWVERFDFSQEGEGERGWASDHG